MFSRSHAKIALEELRAIDRDSIPAELTAAVDELPDELLSERQE
ncbi:hypothetical protein [Haloarcula argentinensis]|nr:hypothetical protein [Haloarcula argentinensis]